MKQYSVHYIDRMNYVFACEELLTFTDADAIMEARERPLPRYCGAFEIWRDESLVFRGAVQQPWTAATNLGGEASQDPHRSGIPDLFNITPDSFENEARA